MTKHQREKIIMLAGGYTAGPIVPLLAVAEEWQKNDKHIRAVVIDVKGSISEQLQKKEKFIYHRIVTGKLRRYWSWRTLLLPVQLFIGLMQSFYFLSKYRPVAVLGAGGFVQIPLMLAAWVVRVPRFIHQQDVAPTLSNSLAGLLANRITVTFESSIRDFPQGTGLGKKFVSTNKVIWTGNPRPAVEHKTTKTEALKKFGLNHDLPVLLVVGGGTGAAALNELVYGGLADWTKVVQIIHSVGRGKQLRAAAQNYHPFEYIDDMDAAYMAADVVISRAGLGALTGLAEYRKPSIIIPMPDTHQEQNAQLVYERDAGIVLDQTEIDSKAVLKIVRELFFKPDVMAEMGKNLHELFPLHAAHKIYKTITDYLEENESK